MRKMLLVAVLYWTAAANAVENVVWTNINNVSTSTGDLRKSNGCEGCYDAGAVSQQQAVSGSSGYVEFTFNNARMDLNTTTIVGIGSPSSPGIPKSGNVRYAFKFIKNPGTNQIRIQTIVNGEAKYDRYPAPSGLRYRISWTPNGVSFRIMSETTPYYTVTEAVSFPLVMNAAFPTWYTNIKDYQIERESVTQQPPPTYVPPTPSSGPVTAIFSSRTNVETSAGDFRKQTGNEGEYNSGAISDQQISKGNTGYIDFQINLVASSAPTIVGLGNPQYYNVADVTSPRYALRFGFAAGTAQAYIGANLVATKMFASGDRFRITITPNSVSFQKMSEGAPFYSANDSITWNNAAEMLFPSWYSNVKGMVIAGAVVAPPPPPAGGNWSSNSLAKNVVVNFDGSGNITPRGGAAGYTNNPPAYNNVYTDRAFGTPILRASNYNCIHSYSYWRAFNANNKLVLISCNNQPAKAYGFNPDTFQMTGNNYDLPSADGLITAYDWASNPNTPNRLFYTKNNAIYYIDLGTGPNGANVGPSLVADFNNGTQFDRVLGRYVSGILSGQVLCQFSKSVDDDTFAFHRVAGSLDNCANPGTNGRGYVVYKRSTNTIYVNTCHTYYNGYCDVNEVHISKGGNYLSLSTDFHVNGVILGIMKVDDVNSMQLLYANNVQKPEGHYDLGYNNIVGVDGSYDNGMHVRSLANPATPSSFKYIGSIGGWSFAIHVSLNFDYALDGNGNEKWALVSSYSMSDCGYQSLFDRNCGGSDSASDGVNDAYQITLPYQNEIWLLATDGSSVRRIAHHMSIPSSDGYWAMPRANISRDGRFVVYTSSWGGANSVYIAKIPPP
jgi:hypothetical protein